MLLDNNRVVTDSLTVAECFGKRHADVLRDIEVQLEKLQEAGEREWGLLNFEETRYQHPQNKQYYRKYNMTKEGFLMLVSGYITPKAMLIKKQLFSGVELTNEQIQNIMEIEVPTVKQKGFVYILKADNGFTKIGKTTNPEKRIFHFTTRMPLELKLECLIESEDYNELERELHERFSDKRTRGEWFELSEDDIETIKLEYAEFLA